MQNIGERLEEARKRKGISIREAAETTKIRSDYLQKFEANAFDLDLPPLYIRGFVRAYARFLELDADRFIAEYDSVVAAEGGRAAPARRESRETYGRVEFAEGGEGGATGRPQFDQALLLKYGLFGGGAVLLLIVIIVLITTLTSRSPSKPAATPPVAAQSAQPAEVAQTLTFTATDTVRVKIVKDDAPANTIVFDGTLGRSETRSFRKTGRLLITVEDRTKLRMEVNGRSYGIPQFPGGGNYGRFALD